MSYNPNIPQPTDNISTSQGQILANFSQANTIFGQDHKAFNDASNQGIHKQVNLVDQTGGVPSVNAGAAGLVAASKLDPSSWITPAWKVNPGGGVTNIPMAAIRAMSVGLISGGSVTTTSSFNVSGIAYDGVGRYTVTFSQAVPFTGINYLVIGSCINTSSSSRSFTFLYSNQSGSGFKININSVNTSSSAPDDPTGFSFVVLQI